MKFTNILKYKIFDSNLIELQVYQLIIIFFLIVLNLFLIKKIKKFTKTKYFEENHYNQIILKIFLILRYSSWIIILIISLNLIAVDFDKLLSYKIIKTKNFSFTPYDFIIVIIILVATWTLLLGIKRLFLKIVHDRKLDIGMSNSFFQIVKYIIWIIAILIALDSVGIKPTILLAGSAALLVGLGMGINQIFNDIISGIILLFEGNIKIKDIVQVDDFVGKVKNIGIRTSKIITRDNIEVVVPNSKFISHNVINWSLSNKITRFNVQVGVAYGSNVELVKSILLDCAASHDKILKTPKPIVLFVDFGNSSLDFQTLFWLNEPFIYDVVKSDIRFLINQKFIENNIEIPFPQRDIHIKTQTNI